MKQSCLWLSGDQCTHPKIAKQVTCEDCAVCPKFVGSFRGAGDLVHAVAKVTGIAALAERLPFDCGCAKRRAALNAAAPFDDKEAGT